MIALAVFVAQAFGGGWWLSRQFGAIRERLVRIETHLGIDPEEPPRLHRAQALSPQTRRGHP